MPALIKRVLVFRKRQYRVKEGTIKCYQRGKTVKESKWVKMDRFEKNVSLELVEKLWNEYSPQQILSVS